MGKPLLSVCVITYNHALYIRQALDSVLSQKVNFDWEIIIADDFSTDGTREIIQEYHKKYPDLIKLILQKKNVGAESNWLDLIRYPKSRYIAYLEGDDYWDDISKLQMQVDFLEKYLDYAFCFHQTKVFFENNEERPAVWPKNVSPDMLTIESLLKENFIPSNSVVYRRQNYSNYPKGIMPGDWYLHLYHAQFGKFGYIDRVMSAYRRHSGGSWWGSHGERSEFWIKNGVMMLALHSELLKMYGDNEKYKFIIGESAANMLDKLAEIDRNGDSRLVAEAIQRLPEITENGILHQQLRNDEAEKLAEQNAEKIEALTVEVLELRTATFNLRDELHALRNSRVVGRVIKLRDKIGSPYTLPKRSVNKTRRAVAKYVPDSIRLPLMKSLRAARDNVRQGVTSRRGGQAVTVEVKGKVWAKGAPLVSVVIPYYNRADTIDETLESLKLQTFQDFEVILVDDKSTDKKSIQKLDHLKGVRVIRQKTNQGVASARNTGIADAKGKYVVCLDSDDLLDDTFIEKAVLVLETSPDTSLVGSYQDMFGVMNEIHEKHPYDALRLMDDNMIITAAMFRRDAWKKTKGYKSDIGYEDWEFWITLAENGFWGKVIPEPLFKYRTSMQSRYVEDKDVHWNNVKTIRELHTEYKKRIRTLKQVFQKKKHTIVPATALINMQASEAYIKAKNKKPRVLVAMPWMTFGGAETLIYNFCRLTMNDYDVSFVTGLASKNEWEYKFREISRTIYHLPNLFEDKALYSVFIKNLVRTRGIDVVHIVHTDFVFEMLEEIKVEFPKLKVIVTMFNDRVPHYVSGVIEHSQNIDIVTSDNSKTIASFKEKLPEDASLRVIPNGINSDSEFNPDLFDRHEMRGKLGLKDDELAVFFVGRLSEEKNPDVFMNVAANILTNHKQAKLKFFVIGDGPMRSDVDKILHELNSDKITYLGYQSEVARYLSAADVFVLPSAIEGFPLSILEAMAMKVVVIASRVGAIPDVIVHGKNGFIIEPGSTEEIVSIILDLDNNRGRAEEIKQAERKIIEDTYSHRQLEQNYKKLYKDVLK